VAQTKRVLKTWTRDDEKTLRALVKAGEPTSKIAKQLKRGVASVRSKAQKLSLSLKAKKPAAKKKAVAKKK
jgi:hypothetical protein